MSEREVFVGVDVSKAHLDVGISGSVETRRFPNTARGVSELVEFLREGQPALVVMESTGGFEVPAAAAIAAAGLAVVIANPRQVRDFAKATGQLGKTDELDARILALLAERVRPPVRPLPDAAARTSPGRSLPSFPNSDGSRTRRSPLSSASHPSPAIAV